MTIEELRKAAESEREARKKYAHHVCVCIAAGCLSSGADQVLDAIKKEVAESGMKHEVLVKGVGCMGLCSAGPLVSVETEGQLYAGVTPEEAPEIIRSLDAGGGEGLTELPHQRALLRAAEEDRAGELAARSIRSASKTTSPTMATAPWSPRSPK